MVSMTRNKHYYRHYQSDFDSHQFVFPSVFMKKKRGNIHFSVWVLVCPLEGVKVRKKTSRYNLYFCVVKCLNANQKIPAEITRILFKFIENFEQNSGNSKRNFLVRPYSTWYLINPTKSFRPARTLVGTTKYRHCNTLITLWLHMWLRHIINPVFCTLNLVGTTRFMCEPVGLILPRTYQR